ncbi:mannose-6-phosphate isomerase, type 1 [Ekhidna lutea]|uniref:Mannose-6-phosphate isomerase, type 1 n=1 Tax=Ekhidna lutea TaxID=447679 RepID=A0A239EQE5_EKHLU|nr:type I phosphomannose isomerase catalytic subunit [Ekhidna lutea]SNS46799.1 mannose-6-phosphate isomerase, type 1 [Ekhidna lutea]
MSQLYPLKFNPIFKEKLWGGQKIKTILGKDLGDLDNCGETWELSGVPGNTSIVSEGVLKGHQLTNLISEYKADLVGSSIYQQFGAEFPLLIKFIDAAKDLSIQVHPDDKLAQKRHNCPGKAEMWYVVQADQAASLINGFKKDSNKEEYLTHLESGQLTSLLHREEVKEGDAFYLPAGRVHTIGKGLLIAEVQQTSDVTYRIYDFDRIDKGGKKRELHTELALDAIDFSKPEQLKSKYETVLNEAIPIVSTPYFSTNKFILDQPKTINRSELDCFKIYIAVGGSGKIGGETIKFGEVILVPACMKQYNIEPDGELELLETYIEL